MSRLNPRFVRRRRALECRSCGARFEGRTREDSEIEDESERIVAFAVFPDTFVIPVEDGWHQVRLNTASFPTHCPGCDQQNVRKIFKVPFQKPALGSAALGDCRYPRFDRGLGMWLTNEQHRKDVCRRHGLVPDETPGGSELPTTVTRKWSESDALVEQHNARLRQYEEDPQFADFRAARDKGELNMTLEARSAE